MTDLVHRPCPPETGQIEKKKKKKKKGEKMKRKKRKKSRGRRTENMKFLISTKLRPQKNQILSPSLTKRNKKRNNKRRKKMTNERKCKKMTENDRK